MNDQTLANEFRRLTAAKNDLRRLIQICDDMPACEQRDEIFVKIRRIIDCLEAGANALRCGGDPESPEIH